MTDLSQEKGQIIREGRVTGWGMEGAQGLKELAVCWGCSSDLAGKDNQGMPAPPEVFQEHLFTPSQ